MGLWKKPQPRTTWTDKPDFNVNDPVIPSHPRWEPIPNSLAYHHRIEFNPGAPAFAYALYGPLEYPVLQGFNNRFQFKVFQPPATIYGQELMHRGLGQSWTAQGPAPLASHLYTPDEMDQLMAVAVANAGYAEQALPG